MCPLADKASNGRITTMVECLLCLLAGEVSEHHIVVAEDAVRSLAVEAIGGGIPATGECPVRKQGLIRPVVAVQSR